jgi:hypothetical protein
LLRKKETTALLPRGNQKLFVHKLQRVYRKKQTKTKERTEIRAGKSRKEDIAKNNKYIRVLPSPPYGDRERGATF